MEENEFIEVVRESLKDHTIEEALKIKEEQDKVIKESFDITWEHYNSVEDQRKEMLKSIATIKFRFVFLELLCNIINYNALCEISYLQDVISHSRMELKDQKKLLSIIKENIEKLQRNDIVECNYNLCELLSKIYEKDQMLFNDLIREMEISTAAIKGISITYSDSKKDAIKELNNEIDNDIKVLGLCK